MIGPHRVLLLYWVRWMRQPALHSSPDKCNSDPIMNGKGSRPSVGKCVQPHYKLLPVQFKAPATPMIIRTKAYRKLWASQGWVRFSGIMEDLLIRNVLLLILDSVSNHFSGLGGLELVLCFIVGEINKHLYTTIQYIRSMHAVGFSNGAKTILANFVEAVRPQHLHYQFEDRYPQWLWDGVQRLAPVKTDFLAAKVKANLDVSRVVDKYFNSGDVQQLCKCELRGPEHCRLYSGIYGRFI